MQSFRETNVFFFFQPIAGNRKKTVYSLLLKSSTRLSLVNVEAMKEWLKQILSILDRSNCIGDVPGDDALFKTFL